jgi:hypothetical protein
MSHAFEFATRRRIREEKFRYKDSFGKRRKLLIPVLSLFWCSPLLVSQKELALYVKNSTYL